MRAFGPVRASSKEGSSLSWLKMSPSITAGLGNLQIIWSWRRDGYNWVIATTARSKWPGEGWLPNIWTKTQPYDGSSKTLEGRPTSVRSLDRGSAAPNIFRMQTGTETMKTWSRPRTVPLLLRVCYWFSSFVEKWECRRVWQNECKRTQMPGSGNSSLNVESFLSEKAAVWRTRGFRPETLWK